MSFQLDLCYFCLKYLIDTDEYKWLCKKNENQYNITYLEKIDKNFIFSKTVPRKDILESKLCLDCCKTIDEMCKFSEKCVKNINIFNQYKKKLCSTNYKKQEKLKIILPKLSKTKIEEMRSKPKNTNNEAIKDIKLEVKEEMIEEEMDYHFEEIEKHENLLNEEFLIENYEVKLEKDDSRDCLSVCSGSAQNLDYVNVLSKNEMASNPSNQDLLDITPVRNNQSDIAVPNQILIYPTNDQLQFVDNAANTHSDTLMTDQFPSNSCQTSQNDIDSLDTNLDGFRKILPKPSDSRKSTSTGGEHILLYINNPSTISASFRKILPKKVSLSNKKEASDNVCQNLCPVMSMSKTKEGNNVDNDSDNKMCQTLAPQMSLSNTFLGVETRKNRRKDVVTIKGGTYEFQSSKSVPNKSYRPVNVANGSNKCQFLRKGNLSNINEPVSVRNDNQMNPSQNLGRMTVIGNPDMSVSSKIGIVTVRNDIPMNLLNQNLGFPTTFESVTVKSQNLSLPTVTDMLVSTKGTITVRNDLKVNSNQNLGIPTVIGNPDMSMSNKIRTVTVRNDIQMNQNQISGFLNTIITPETVIVKTESQLDQNLSFPTVTGSRDISMSNTEGTVTVRNDLKTNSSQSQGISTKIEDMSNERGTVTVKNDMSQKSSLTQSELGDEHDSSDSGEPNSGNVDLNSAEQNARKYPLIDLNRWKIYDEKKDLDTVICVAERNFECDLCSSKFLTAKNLSNHKSKVHSEKKFQCEICTYTCTSLYSLRSHMKTHENGEFECAICKKVFKTEAGLKNHQIVHEENAKKYVCNVCGKSLAYRKSYNHHMKLHFGKIEKKFSCKICNTGFAQQYMLTKHLSVHTGEKNEKCDICAKTFRLKHTLKQHKKAVHGEQKVFSCTICDATFAQQNKLTKHLSIHSGEKKEKCDLCAKSFRLKYTLKLHKKTVHSEEKMFSCEFCDKKFKYINSIKAHTLTHTKEKNYDCHLCEKKFAQKSNLRLHFLSHFKELTFECDICHKKFTSDFYMKRHRKFHFKKPFSCKICQQSFTAKHSLTQHERKHELVSSNENGEQQENMSTL